MNNYDLVSVLKATVLFIQVNSRGSFLFPQGSKVCVTKCSRPELRKQCLTSEAFSGDQIREAGNSRSRARAATGDGSCFLPRPRAAGGWVTMAATYWRSLLAHNATHDLTCSTGWNKIAGEPTLLIPKDWRMQDASQGNSNINYEPEFEPVHNRAHFDENRHRISINEAKKHFSTPKYCNAQSFQKPMAGFPMKSTSNKESSAREESSNASNTPAATWSKHKQKSIHQRYSTTPETSNAERNALLTKFGEEPAKLKSSNSQYSTHCNDPILTQE